jgi:hypothetical protein
MHYMKAIKVVYIYVQVGELPKLHLLAELPELLSDRKHFRNMYNM